MPAPEDHPYLLRKAIRPTGLRLSRGVLVVPVLDTCGVLHSLQFIGTDGAQRFLRGGRVGGCFFPLGPVGEEVCIAEGVATAATIHQASGFPVAAAFSAGNLLAVARALRTAHPGARIILCADDDAGSADNPGMRAAHAAALAIDALLAVPDFGTGRTDGATDFNDLARMRGDLAVREGIAQANAPRRAATSRARRSASWPEPEALARQAEAEHYPVQALPGILREAVDKVHAFVQAPLLLVACSALSGLSLAAQGLVDVRRDRHRVGPVSLYMLAVADSGERKTTCDTIFGGGLRDWEAERLQAMEPEIVRLAAALEAHEAKKAGILEAIKARRRRGENTVAREQELEALARELPPAPVIPRLLYADATPEALAHALATGWPSGGVLSSEAGAVLGAHGMGAETILRNLALLNVLCGEMAVDRKTCPSFLLRGRCLTFGAMVQPEALRSFLGRAGTLPRGTGFIARLLIAWPVTTQGTCAYRPPPDSMPAVDRYRERIIDLLAQPLPTDPRGGLCPPALELSAAARSEWIRFHDYVERELGVRCEFRNVRDVAAKAAENAARVAALFHLLEHGATGTIGAETMAAAGGILAWHLTEARRLLAGLAMPPDLVAALRLEEWLLSEANAQKTDRVSTRRVRQFGPNCVRGNADLLRAVALLTERGRVCSVEDGRQRNLVINPALLERGGESTE